MNTSKSMPKWCLRLPENPVDCYVSDVSNEHALERRRARSVTLYDTTQYGGYYFSALVPKRNGTLSLQWKFAVPVDEALRGKERVK